MGKKHRMNQWDQKEQEGAQEGLNEYIRVTSPGTLVVILSLLILLAATIIWGFAGTLPVTETVTGVVIDCEQYRKLYPEYKDLIPEGKEETLVLCFVDASRYNGQAIREFGAQAGIRMPDQSTCTGTYEAWFREPVSMDNARHILFDNEWVLEKCVTQDYNWLLAIRPDEDLSRYAFTLAEVTLLTEEVAPISFLVR